MSLPGADSDPVAERAKCILGLRPDPVPRYRILKDLLRLPSSDALLSEAKRVAMTSRWVRELGDAQLADGSWGRFHSIDSKRRTRPGTTEAAISRSIELGLGMDDEILRRAKKYLEDLLAEKLAFPDPPEANDRWPVGREMFVAATMAELDPAHSCMAPIYDKWLAVAERSFECGQYDAEREWMAHCERTGATSMRGSYLRLDNKYAVSLLSHVQDRLSDPTEAALTRWLWHGQGLGYIRVPPSLPVVRLNHRTAQGWLRTQLRLSRFRSWATIAHEAIAGVWNLEGRDGLWDFGPTRGMRLSETWRERQNRKIDHSISVLLVQLAFQDAGDT